MQEPLALSTLVGMVGTSLTLAALATSAVSGLEVLGYQDFTESDASVSGAVLSTSQGEVLIRVPRNETAEVHQSAQILGQTALTEGVRSQLTFEAPRVLGVTRAAETRALVTSYLNGERFVVDDLSEDALLLESLAHAIASIHNLPISIVKLQGLTVRQSTEVRADCSRLVERAYKTNLLPETLKQRWDTVLSATELWDFQPVVVHGSLDDEQFLLEGSAVTGVLGWSELAVSDPAIDFSWCVAAGRNILHAMVTLYTQLHPNASTSGLLKRAQFWHELQLARWLLHGVELRDEEIIEDAVALLDNLIDHMGSGDAATPAAPTVEDVEDMLDETPEVTDLLSDTAAYDSLDDDRVFTPDSDFIESENNETTSASERSSDSGERLQADDQLTEPVDQLDFEPDPETEPPHPQK